MSDDSWRPRVAELSWTELQKKMGETDIVVIPVGAIEQHGPHLPLCTDSMNIQSVAEDAARLERVFVAPTVVYGVSDNHMAFCGTISLKPQTLINVLVDIGTSLFVHGFRRLLFLNGHGGNYDAMGVAAHELRLAHRDAVVALSDVVGFIYDSYVPTSGIIYHADEGETAHSLAVAPDLVRMDRAVRDISKSFSAYYERYYAKNGPMTGRISYGVPPTETLTTSGVMGDASAATREAGDRMHMVAVDGLRKILRDLKTKTPMPEERR
jgi:creatinine amidohydrolase